MIIGPSRQKHDRNEKNADQRGRGGGLLYIDGDREQQNHLILFPESKTQKRSQSF